MNSAAQAFRLFFVAIFLFCFVACSQRVSEQILPETEEPIFRRAKEMLDRGLAPEALINFGKLIIKRNGDAPESHLEAGLIYLNSIKDPISAYYHFNQYKAIVGRVLEGDARENSIRRVDELLKSARKELLAQFPSDVYKDPLERIKLIDTIESLRAENNTLKDALNVSRSKLRQLAEAPRYTPSASDSVLTVEAEAPVVSSASAPVVRNDPPPSRSYTVKKGDSLYNISVQHYGVGNRWQEILDANRAILPSKDHLQPGMRLRIP